MHLGIIRSLRSVSYRNGGYHGFYTLTKLTYIEVGQSPLQFSVRVCGISVAAKTEICRILLFHLVDALGLSSKKLWLCFCLILLWNSIETIENDARLNFEASTVHKTFYCLFWQWHAKALFTSSGLAHLGEISAAYRWMLKKLLVFTCKAG